MQKCEGHEVLPDTGPNTYHPNEPLLLTVKQACRQLNLGRTSLFALMTVDGGLERKKLGRATRVTLASVRRVAQDGATTRPPSTEARGDV